MSVKGIILAGGKGTRLYPMTSAFSKQLQPVYDKPMIYYPIATLMLAGIRDILLISTPDDTPHFQKLLGDGSQWGINLEYVVQETPAGLPQAYILGEKFINGQRNALILGDNLFYGKLNFFYNALQFTEGGRIFAYRVDKPEQYGVVEFGKDNSVISIEEKPLKPKSNYAIPGLYLFDGSVCEVAKGLKPSARGELEITDVHKEYLKRGNLKVEPIGRGVAWLDTGSPQDLAEAGAFIMAIEKRQGAKIACLEEIALAQNYINKEEYLKTVAALPNCEYKSYCLKIANEF